MKFKKQFEEPVIFPVKLELGSNLCQTGSPTLGEGMDDEGEEDW